MDNKEFSVRSVQKEDSRRIWEIRNSPEVRRVSNNQDVTPFDSHNSWFRQKYFRDAGNHCFVLSEEKKVIGYCRFDKQESGIFVISIGVDPGYHGRGLGSFLLKEALALFDIPAVIEAEIHVGNLPSQNLFESFGFYRFKEGRHSVYYRLDKL